MELTKEQLKLRRQKYRIRFEDKHKGEVKLSNSKRDKMRRHRRSKKLRLVAEMGGACSRCGWNEHPYGFDFDHKDPLTKEMTPSYVLYSRGYPKAKEYIMKNCQLLCANCHGLKTVAFADNVDPDRAYDMKEDRETWFKGFKQKVG